jgi:hypothetical protein
MGTAEPIGGSKGVLDKLREVVCWRLLYPFTAIEVKCWMQVDERRGYELVPMIRLNNSNWFYATAQNNPLKLDNRYEYTIEAPKEYQGGEFVSWQSEKTGMIVPDTKLVLKKYFESDTWWQNYALKHGGLEK